MEIEVTRSGPSVSHALDTSPLVPHEEGHRGFGKVRCSASQTSGREYYLDVPPHERALWGGAGAKRRRRGTSRN